MPKIILDGKTKLLDAGELKKMRTFKAFDFAEHSAYVIDPVTQLPVSTIRPYRADKPEGARTQARPAGPKMLKDSLERPPTVAEIAAGSFPMPEDDPITPQSASVPSTPAEAVETLARVEDAVSVPSVTCQACMVCGRAVPAGHGDRCGICRSPMIEFAPAKATSKKPVSPEFPRKVPDAEPETNCGRCYLPSKVLVRTNYGPRCRDCFARDCDEATVAVVPTPLPVVLEPSPLAGMNDLRQSMGMEKIPEKVAEPKAEPAPPVVAPKPLAMAPDSAKRLKPEHQQVLGDIRAEHSTWTPNEIADEFETRTGYMILKRVVKEWMAEPPAPSPAPIVTGKVATLPMTQVDNLRRAWKDKLAANPQATPDEVATEFHRRMGRELNTATVVYYRPKPA